MNDTTKWVIKIAVFLVGLGLCIGASFIYTKSMQASYEEKSSSIVQSMTDNAKTMGLKLGKEQNHTFDRATISITEIREVARLEVLRASDVKYMISDKDGLSVWISVPGNGTFTVDMQRAEIVTDEVNNSISIRIPKPEMLNCTINYDGVEKIHFENKKWIFDNVSDGTERYSEMMKEAQEQFKTSLNSSFFRENAEKNARRMVTSLAHDANPDNPDLKVYVDFFV